MARKYSLGRVTAIFGGIMICYIFGIFVFEYQHSDGLRIWKPITRGYFHKEETTYQIVQRPGDVRTVSFRMITGLTESPEYQDSALLNMPLIANESFPSVTFGSRNFSHYVRNYCQVNSKRRVPNIIHYVWFDIKEMTFYQMISFLSVHRFQKPCLILLHGNVIPAGPYWRHLVRHVSNIIHVKLDGPIKTERNELINDNPHKSDLVRLMVLKEFGGIYLDLDTVLLRSLDPLMNYPVTMSLEYWSNLSNGLIVAERDALFIRQWLTLFHEQYYYDRKKYFEFSLFMPSRIAKTHPSWIHVENMTFCTPSGNNTHQIFNENYDWKENYAMHLYLRFYKVKDDFTSIRRLNATIGALARFVLYATKDLLED